MSARKRWSTSARSTLAISQTVLSSPARSSGMVATTTPPARSTANQQATRSGLFGPRNRHSIPGNQAEVVGQGGGDAVGAGQKVCIGPDRCRPICGCGAEQARPVGAVSGDGRVEQFDGTVQPLGIGQLGQQGDHLRPAVLGRQAVAAEGIAVRRLRKFHRHIPLGPDALFVVFRSGDDSQAIDIRALGGGRCRISTAAGRLRAPVRVSAPADRCSCGRGDFASDVALGVSRLGPAGEGLREVVLAAKGIEVAWARCAARLERSRVVEIAAHRRHAAAGEAADAVSGTDVVVEGGGGSVDLATEVKSRAAESAGGAAGMNARCRWRTARAVIAASPVDQSGSDDGRGCGDVAGEVGGDGAMAGEVGREVVQAGQGGGVDVDSQADPGCGVCAAVRRRVGLVFDVRRGSGSVASNVEASGGGEGVDDVGERVGASLPGVSIIVGPTGPIGHDVEQPHHPGRLVRRKKRSHARHVVGLGLAVHVPGPLRSFGAVGGPFRVKPDDGPGNLGPKLGRSAGRCARRCGVQHGVRKFGGKARGGLGKDPRAQRVDVAATLSREGAGHCVHEVQCVLDSRSRGQRREVKRSTDLHRCEAGRMMGDRGCAARVGGRIGGGVQGNIGAPTTHQPWRSTTGQRRRHGRSEPRHRAGRKQPAESAASHPPSRRAAGRPPPRPGAPIRSARQGQDRKERHRSPAPAGGISDMARLQDCSLNQPGAWSSSWRTVGNLLAWSSAHEGSRYNDLPTVLVIALHVRRRTVRWCQIARHVGRHVGPRRQPRGPCPLQERVDKPLCRTQSWDRPIGRPTQSGQQRSSLQLDQRLGVPEPGHPNRRHRRIVGADQPPPHLTDLAGVVADSRRDRRRRRSVRQGRQGATAGRQRRQQVGQRVLELLDDPVADDRP